MCNNNRNTLLFAKRYFLHFLGRTLNKFYKPLVTIIICNEKQKHCPCKQ